MNHTTPSQEVMKEEKVQMHKHKLRKFNPFVAAFIIALIILPQLSMVPEFWINQMNSIGISAIVVFGLVILTCSSSCTATQSRSSKYKASSTSLTLVTIGRRMCRLLRPILALSMARICEEKISGWSSVKRMPRQPNAEFSSSIEK